MMQANVLSRSNGTSILRTRDLRKIYETGSLTVTALEQVSIDVRAGEFVALVGPSGSGKTTLLAILAGLLSPTDGKVIISGQDMSSLPEKERTRFRRRQIGFTFQSNNLVPYLTALENVELMLRLNKHDAAGRREQARDLLVRLGLEDRLNNLPSQLSGGQQQRVAIARALVHNPSLVLADEPTASLDTERAFQVVETFADLVHEQGKAGIMVTHDLRMVRSVDKVIQMVDGGLAGVITDRSQIDAMAQAGQFIQPRQAPSARHSRAPHMNGGWAATGGD
jgi:putative ABC transport system ATP-binding protein